MAILLAYGIGSTLFAWLLARRWGAGDLRRVGSGNIGAANVFRASGVAAGVLVAVLDVAKGVATACGVFAMLSPAAVAPALAVFVGTVWITKYVSLASVLASLALPPMAYATGSPGPVVIVSCAASALIVFRHRSNVARLRTGTELRIGARG